MTRPSFKWVRRNQDYTPMRCTRCGFTTFFHDTSGHRREAYGFCEGCRNRCRHTVSGR